MLPEAVRAWCRQNGYGEVTERRSVGGGCINNGARLITDSGGSLFIKTNASGPEDMFAREFEGLEALRQPDGPRVPEPYLHGRDFLLLEDLDPAPRGRDYWPLLGWQLAALHIHVNDQFGFPHDNYIGSTPQPNTWTEDGFAFFAEHRLGYQAELAGRKGLLSAKQVEGVGRLAAGLPELVPAQPASLIHGDLWGGNAIADSQGAPALIDPAAHYGWAEAELAMTALFGGFSDSFYVAYVEARPLESGWRERFPIYNLYHLLNHLNLFGAGYRGQVLSIVHAYA